MAAKRGLLPDSPAVAVVSAVFALVLAVVLFIAALPGEERVLLYEGREVGPTAVCETTGPDGETVTGACVEIGQYETRETGWKIPAIVGAVVVAALASVVLAAVPAQARRRRERREKGREFATDEDDRLGR